MNTTFNGASVGADVAVLSSGIDLDHPDLNVFRPGAVNCVYPNPYGPLIQRMGQLRRTSSGIWTNVEVRRPPTTWMARAPTSLAPSGRWTTPPEWSESRPVPGCGRFGC